MKSFLQNVFSPILSFFEDDSENYTIATWKRPVLFLISITFLGLAIAVPVFSPEDIGFAVLLPVIVFGSLGFTGFIVSALGSDHAVAKILGGL
jgi:hypothetical protein